MANRYSTIDELNETEALIKTALVTIREMMTTQQNEIKLIAKELETLQEEVRKLNGGKK